ncbi:flagellin N-terminal helical domain-containing protein [Aquitalea aquatica]|uniref:Flagellin n=1 Tax=Aquitalea aquatica TaxID=3044273 RepID=A0A838YFJ4_9NEIS|nr:flagellin [Aquitalea magnusonii]MBA4709514.1 flagellin FliC [Aquitalea magnusonii]
MLSISSNLGALNAQTQLDKSRKNTEQTLAQLASGTQLSSAAVNAANTALSQSLEAQVRGDNQASSNALDGISMVQTADSALSQLQDNSQQLQDLAIQAGDAALSSSNRQSLQQQADQLTQSNSAIIQNTQYNGSALLSSNNALQFQVGPNGDSSKQITVNTSNLSASPTGGGLHSYNANLNATGTIDLSSPASALAAQGNIQSDLNTISSSRTQLGASSNQFSAAINNLQNSSLNAQAANSRISDTDYAAATAQLVQQQILGQAAIAIQGQANVSQRSALSLLG